MRRARARDHRRPSRRRSTRCRRIESWLGANTKYSLNAPLSPRGRRRRRRLLVPQPARLVRADREQPRGAGAQRRHPGPARHRLRARVARRAHGPVRGARDATRTPGPRSTSPASAGRASTRPRRCRSRATPSPAVRGSTDARRNAVPLAIAVVLIVLARGRGARGRRPRVRRRRARRASWSASALHRLERVGRKAGRARAPAETPREYAVRARASGSATTGSPRSATRSTPTLYLGRAARPRRIGPNADAVLTSL